MGKKNKTALGQSILKGRSRAMRGTRHAESWLHTSELNDGSDLGKYNIGSITEQSDLDEFLASAQLAGTQFTADKLNVTVVVQDQNAAVLTTEKAMHIKQAQDENRQLLCIPRRPEWNTSMSTDELDEKERESFVEWRRQLSKLQEKDHIILTPFEKNLDFWRQLWRVIERSDVVVQIVDARNPLLFRCEDLEVYVKEVSCLKANLLLINKADYLSPVQRSMWERYFKSKDIAVAFWSALEENERLLKTDDESTKDKLEKSQQDSDEGVQDEGNEDNSILTENITARFSKLLTNEAENTESLPENNSALSAIQEPDSSTLSTECDNSCRTYNETETCVQQVHSMEDTNDKKIMRDSVVSEDSSRPDCQACEECGGATSEIGSQSRPHLCTEFTGRLMSGDEIIELCQRLHHNAAGQSSDATDKTITTIGLVGYPNVGKSSTINTILQAKKVPVSITPGRTKHFQTLQLSSSVCLCDCPGLVFPSFVSTKAEMVVSGILPIDQMRDHISPVTLVCQRIPRVVLEVVYGINIPDPLEGEDPDRPPHADELLNTYGYMRGYMTSSGTPDCPRSSRYILKDYVKGKLLYCFPPPGIDAQSFQESRYSMGKYGDMEILAKSKDEQAVGDGAKPKMSQMDKEFMTQKNNVSCFTKGHPSMVRGQPQALSGSSMEDAVYKPWKKHHNRNKKEKLRRLAKT